MNIRTKATAISAVAFAAAIVAPTAASAQVAGVATVSKVRAIMGAKAFGAGYTTIETQGANDLNRAKQLQTELQTLSKPMDSDGDGNLTNADKAWTAALQAYDAAVKAADKNNDKNLTGNEITELRAKNLPAQQILEKQQEISDIERKIQVSQLYVVDAINRKYNDALKAVVTAKKINVVFAPEAVEWAPNTIDVTSQVVAEIDKALPAVTLPAPENFSTSNEALNLHGQIERIITNAVVAQARAQAAKQQGAQPAAPATGTQPAPAQPAPGATEDR